ncbi:cyclin N-terminal domain-containing protein 1 isoform X1 [Leucoraja erinacea]|uniref:cyclin N-terminal domain-containing protein 1 isoform X1 n=1 Tax=Leucoraja erinaceus TaxID=7782 RepID=UPI0024539E39|nr:cyclin N-terminal domain-containing protein 1 isoform X1 [Leucoraja erinacea]
MMMMTTRVVVVRVDESRACGPQTPELAFVAASPEMLEEFLVDVAKENENHLLKLPQHAGSFKKLRLIGSDKDTEKNDWTLTQITIQEHFVLRIMSCVQIASKISFHYQIVNNDMALKFLQSLGYSYKREDLLDSELLVLKTLNFQVNVPTPFTHTEILLEVMGYNDPSVPVKYLHSISLKVLTFVYLMRNTIYENLLKIAIENSTPTDLQRQVLFVCTLGSVILLTHIWLHLVNIINSETKCSSRLQLIEYKQLTRCFVAKLNKFLVT